MLFYFNSEPEEDNKALNPKQRYVNEYISLKLYII